MRKTQHFIQGNNLNKFHIAKFSALFARSPFNTEYFMKMVILFNGRTVERFSLGAS